MTAAAAAAAAASAPSARRQDVVGVRELRQNLSVYLDRVKKGEALQVTEHGHVVAVLRPVPANASRIDILIAQGLVTPATRSLRDLPPPRKAPPGTPSMSEILDELRSEDRLLMTDRSILDASALVKLLVDERESLALIDYLGGRTGGSMSSELAAVETMRAGRRATVSGRCRRSQAAAVGRDHLTSTTEVCPGRRCH